MSVPTVRSSCSISAATPGTTVAVAGDAGGSTSAVLRSARDGAPIARGAGGTTAAVAAEATAGSPAVVGPGAAGLGGTTTTAAAAAGVVGGTTVA